MFEVIEWAAPVTSRVTMPLTVDGHTFSVTVVQHDNGLVAADTVAVLPTRRTKAQRDRARATNERVCALLADLVRGTGATVAVEHVGEARVGVSGRKLSPEEAERWAAWKRSVAW